MSHGRLLPGRGSLAPDLATPWVRRPLAWGPQVVRASRRRLDELFATASGLVREVRASGDTEHNLRAMLAVAHLLGFIEGIALAGDGTEGATEGALVEVNRLVAEVGARTGRTDLLDSGRRSGVDRRLAEARRGERRLILLPVAEDRREVADRRGADRRRDERRRFTAVVLN